MSSKLPATVFEQPISPSPPNPLPTRPEDSNLVVPLDRLGEKSEHIDCPYCHKRTLTRVTKSSSSSTNLAACVCCLACALLGVFIPYCCHWCNDTDHHCSECRQHVMHKPHDGNAQAVLPQTAQRAMQSVYAPMADGDRSRLETRWSEVRVEGGGTGVVNLEGNALAGVPPAVVK